MHPERVRSKNSRRIQLARRRVSMSSQTCSSVKFAMVLKHDLQVVSSSLNEGAKRTKVSEARVSAVYGVTGGRCI